MKESERKLAAKQFAEMWRDRGRERAESQPFWLSLLRNVWGVPQPETFVQFDERVQLNHTSFMDGIISETNVIIEQKSRNKDLYKPERQSDGTFLTPFEQAKRYSDSLPYSRRARWIVVCNFRSFLVYDMERPNATPIEIDLKNFENEYHHLSFLVDKNDVHLQKEVALSLEASRIIGQVYEGLKNRFVNPESDLAQKSLQILCVRLVFCLFAEHAGLLGRHSCFGKYLEQFSADQIRDALKNLFEVLDTPLDKRNPYFGNLLNSFPYVNGGLFHDRSIELPNFTDELKSLIVRASATFDWGQISPTIFGAVFDSTLAMSERRKTKEYFTSAENIHRVIDPLFLTSWKERLKTILDISVERDKIQGLRVFLKELGALHFFDPAAGSGNFLTETFLSIRHLENQAIAALYQLNDNLDPKQSLRVKVDHFHGIEINSFACSIARASLWIAECQMIQELAKDLRMDLDCLPLRESANIVCGNALRTNWNSIVPASKSPFIIGNPPFAGSKSLTNSQKEDMTKYVFKTQKRAGTLDYVAAWYKKSVDYMRGTDAKAAFVSTCSIVQGEQPGILFDVLFHRGMKIDFAWQPFRWSSEDLGRATVTCVIIGFHVGSVPRQRTLFDAHGLSRSVSRINAYLLDGPMLALKRRGKPLGDVPRTRIGNKPIDDQNYLFTPAQKDEFLKREPRAKRYFRPWVGTEELISNQPRYCLFLADATPGEIKQLPAVQERVAAVKRYRLNRESNQTKALANTPTRFHVTTLLDAPYLAIPEVSSELRMYIPMAFLDNSILCSNLVKVIPGATLYHFGILTSSVHMAWVRAVCGRMEMRYRYSSEIVYNNFPWPSPSARQQKRIEQTAQAILDARSAYPDSSLDALYNSITMPNELFKAHQANDKAVLDAYAMDKSLKEHQIVETLLSLYERTIHSLCATKKKRHRKRSQ